MNSVFDTNHLYKSYFKLSLPLALGMMVSLIYNLADTYFVALTNNTNLIAGVSLCTPLLMRLWRSETFSVRAEVHSYHVSLVRGILTPHEE